MASELVKAKPIIDKYKGEKRALIPILQDVQEKCNWLPPDVLEYVAESIKVPLIDVYSVATFYTSFRLKPRGKHLCTACMGTACHVRGAPIILDHIQNKLGVEAGQTTPDMKYSLERVNCLGACALAPLVVVDGDYYGQMNITKVDSVLRQLGGGRAARKKAKRTASRKSSVKKSKSKKKGSGKKSGVKKGKSRR